MLIKTPYIIIAWFGILTLLAAVVNAEAFKAFGWGNNYDGQLGTNQSAYVSSPTLWGPSTIKWTQVQAGWNRLCGLDINGIAYCMGNNANNANGIDGEVSTHYPKRVDTSMRFKKIAVGSMYTCATRDTNSVYCWGNGDPNPRIMGRGNFTDIAVGEDSMACGIKQQNLYCWNSASEEAELVLTVDDKFDAVSIGSRVLCVIRSGDKNLQCWKDMWTPQYFQYNEPFLTDAEKQWSTIAMGSTFNLALDAIAKNMYGIDPEEGLYPQFIASMTWNYIATGGNSIRACAIKADDNTSIVCWGGGPTVDMSGRKWIAVAEYASAEDETGFVCAIEAGTKQLYCQGTIPGTVAISPNKPKALATRKLFTSAVAAKDYSCGISGDKKLYCMGKNIGTTPRQLAPMDQRWTSLAARDDVLCGINADTFRISCWNMIHRDGPVYLGESGNGIVTSDQKFSKLTLATINSKNGCGIEKWSKKLYCWGKNVQGQLCNGNTINSNSTPVPAGFANQTVAAVAVGYQHICYIDQVSKAMYCCGNNRHFQLGDNKQEQQSATPIKVAGNHKWTSVSSSLDYTCGTTTTNKLLCWGANIPFNRNLHVPRNVTDSSIKWKSVYTTEDNICMIRADTSNLWCLGFGPLVDGDSIFSNHPSLIGSTHDTWESLGIAYDHAIALAKN